MLNTKKLILSLLLLSGCGSFNVLHRKELLHREVLGKCLKVEVVTMENQKRTLVTTDAGHMVIEQEIKLVLNEYIYVVFYKDGSRQLFQEDVKGNRRSIIILKGR